MGIPRCTLDDLKGGNKNVNAQMLMDAFSGEDSHVANALNLNAGVALAACGVANTVEEGILLAMETQVNYKTGSRLRESARETIDGDDHSTTSAYQSAAAG